MLTPQPTTPDGAQGAAILHWAEAGAPQDRQPGADSPFSQARFPMVSRFNQGSAQRPGRAGSGAEAAGKGLGVAQAEAATGRGTEAALRKRSLGKPEVVKTSAVPSISRPYGATRSSPAPPLVQGAERGSSAHPAAPWGWRSRLCPQTHILSAKAHRGPMASTGALGLCPHMSHARKQLSSSAASRGDEGSLCPSSCGSTGQRGLP